MPVRVMMHDPDIGETEQGQADSGCSGAPFSDKAVPLRRSKQCLSQTKHEAVTKRCPPSLLLIRTERIRSILRFARHAMLCMCRDEPARAGCTAAGHGIVPRR